MNSTNKGYSSFPIRSRKAASDGPRLILTPVVASAVQPVIEVVAVIVCSLPALGAVVAASAWGHGAAWGCLDPAKLRAFVDAHYDRRFEGKVQQIRLNPKSEQGVVSLTDLQGHGHEPLHGVKAPPRGKPRLALP